MKEYEILEKAASIVEEKGWIKGRLRDQDGQLCALGALAEAQNMNPATIFSYDKIASAVPGFAEAIASEVDESILESLSAYSPKWTDKSPEEILERLRAVTSPAEYIYRYNDRICRGGPELAEKLRSTARKLRANEKVNHHGSSQAT